jgi:hypothetical protein
MGGGHGRGVCGGVGLGSAGLGTCGGLGVLATVTGRQGMIAWG